jgi:hypothetical protein
MLLPLKLICDAKKVRRDGTTLIYTKYCLGMKANSANYSNWDISNFWN